MPASVRVLERVAARPAALALTAFASASARLS